MTTPRKSFYITRTRNPTRKSTSLADEENDIIVISDDDEVIVIQDSGNDVPIYEANQVTPVQKTDTTNQPPLFTSSSSDINSSLLYT